jgi:hypothetical protein
MSSGKRNTVESPPHTAIFEVFSNSYRRELLGAVLNANPRREDDLSPLDILAPSREADGLRAISIELTHAHLPKLAETGFIDWGRLLETISKGPNWAEIRPTLQWIDDQQGELPDRGARQ